MEANNKKKNSGTQMLLHMVQSAPVSDGSCNSPSGSAVSALQSKFKEISQRRSKGMETHDVPLEGPSEPSQKKLDMERSPPSIPEVKVLNVISSADEHHEEQNLPTASHLKYNKKEMEEEDSLASHDCALGEGTRMENFTPSGDGGTILSKQILSPRYWTSPKGFCRAARRGTLVSKTELVAQPIITKNVVHISKEEQKLIVGGTSLHKELQGLEITFQRCFQTKQSAQDGSGKDNVSNIQSCQRGCKTEAQITKTSSAMLAEGQYQPPLINKGKIF